MTLQGRIAVVTGAAGRLGPIWIDTLLRGGAERVVAFAQPGTEDCSSLARIPRSNVSVRPLDITSSEDVCAAAKATMQEFGTPHVLVASAGIDAPPGAAAPVLAEITPESVAEVLNTNVLGTFLTLQSFGVAMAQEGRGSIVVIGSQYATSVPDPTLYDHLEPPFLKPPAYGASKAALLQLTRHFAALYAPRGVRVNALSPGGVQGSQDPQFISKYAAKTPLGRMASAEELAGPLLFLASDAASYVTGINLLVDGGFSLW